MAKPGSLTYQQQKIWAGPAVPRFVPLMAGKSQLSVLDPIPGGYMALYREPYTSCSRLGSLSSGGLDWSNCEAEVRLFDCSGRVTGSVSLHRYHKRRDHLEVQDVRVDGNTLYFNEACITYSREAGGRCSQLVAVEIGSGKELWRSGYKTSNNVFLVHGDYIIGGYGFTAEPSFLHIFRKRDGKLLHKQALKTRSFPGGNHDHLAIDPRGLLRVGVYEHANDLEFLLQGAASARPTLKFSREIAPRSAMLK